MGDEVEKELLESVDLERRSALKRLLHGAAYVVPVVASFTLSGISPLDVAHAEGNQPVPTLGEWAVPVLGVALATAAVTGLKKV